MSSWRGIPPPAANRLTPRALSDLENTAETGDSRQEMTIDSVRAFTHSIGIGAECRVQKISFPTTNLTRHTRLMAYLRISDDAMDHPKFSPLSDGAFRLWFNANCWCQKHLTDGRIQKRAVRGIPCFSSGRAKQLIQAGLWHDRGDHYEVHDFLQHNDSRQHVERRRAYKRRHNDLYSNPELLQVVRERDGDACRYCGKTVNWHDRRGPFGATYDHVDPNGDNTIENVVVACRGCNSRKRDRSPEEVGFELIPIQLEASSNLAKGKSEPAESQLNTRHLTSPHLSSSKELHRGGESRMYFRGKRLTVSTKMLESVTQGLGDRADRVDWLSLLAAWDAEADAADDLEALNPLPYIRKRIEQHFKSTGGKRKACRYHHDPPCEDDIACLAKYRNGLIEVA